MVNNILKDMLKKNPDLISCENDIKKAFNILTNCYKKKNKLLVCGNGGSASDSEHIVGELMKGFLLKREIDNPIFEGKNLQGALPAISLVSHSSLISAIANDNGSEYVFAQQVMGYGNEKDVLLGLSTSGNSKNVIEAIYVAKSKKLKTIAMTGKSGGKLKEICDCCITVPSDKTYEIQEYHLPIYHCLCAMLEEYFFY